MLRRFLIAASALLAWGELAHWRASRQGLGRGETAQEWGSRRVRSRVRGRGMGVERSSARKADVGEAEAGAMETGRAADVRVAVVVLGFANRGARANFVNRYRVRAGLRSLEAAGRQRAKFRLLESAWLRGIGFQRGVATRCESAVPRRPVRQSSGAAFASRSGRAFADASVSGFAHPSAVSGAAHTPGVSGIACASAVAGAAHASAAADVLVLCGGAVSGPVPEADVMEKYARARGYAGPIRMDRESRSTLQNIENAIPLIEDSDSIAIVSNSVHALKGRILLRRLRPDLADRLVRGADYRFGEQILVKPIAAVAGLADLRTLRRRLSKLQSAA